MESPARSEGSSRSIRSLGWALGASIAVGVAAGVSPHGAAALFWLASLVPPLVLARRVSGRTGRPLRAARVLVLLAAGLLPVAVRIANLDPMRLHGDEYIESYIADTHDFRQGFFTLVPDLGEWNGRLPQPYFLVQRLFLEAFGRGPLAIRLSTQIWVAIVGVCLYLSGEDLLGGAGAWTSVALYAFFAPSVYLETLGIDFAARSAALVFFFHRAVRFGKTLDPFDAALAGLGCGLCYLGYINTYLAFPLFLAFVGLALARGQARRTLSGFGLAAGVMLAVLTPFVTSLVALRDPLFRRVNQVSLLTGAWSPYREAIAQGKRTSAGVIAENLLLCLRAAVRDGIGGSGGYEFGRLAFFDPLTLALFFAGVVVCLAAWRRRPELLLALGVVAAAFFGLVVLTIAPPGWHRFSIGAPFLAVVMAAPFAALFRRPLLPAVRIALPCAVLVLYAVLNECRLNEALVRDAPAPEQRLLELLKQRFGDRMVSIAGDPRAHLRKVFHFRDVPREWDTPPVFAGQWLRRIRPGERYVVVVNRGDSLREKFQKADPEGKYYRVTAYYGIFAH
jgi:hypothetical protein